MSSIEEYLNEIDVTFRKQEEGVFLFTFLLGSGTITFRRLKISFEKERLTFLERGTIYAETRWSRYIIPEQDLVYQRRSNSFALANRPRRRKSSFYFSSPLRVGRNSTIFQTVRSAPQRFRRFFFLL